MLFEKKKIVKTNRKYAEYLPVGSIVKLYNDDFYYMICRYSGNSCMPYRVRDKFLKKSKLFDAQNNDKLYYSIDYFIEDYPKPTQYTMYGIIHEDIEEVIWKGYTDEMRMNILNDIDEWSRENE